MRAQTGSAAVEIALVLPLILALLLAVAEVAVVARTQLELANVAREGARVAAVSPEPADAVAAVQELLGDLAGDARISVTRPNVVGESAVVTITFHHRLAPFFFGGSGVELRARAAMRVER